MPVRRLCSIGAVAALCTVVAACSSNGSPTTPSHTAISGGATIVGHVNGFSSSTNSQRLDSSARVETSHALASTTNASTTLTVSINGTSITSSVDGNGNFQLTGVPPGNVTLMFSGAGANASITLNNVAANSQISITVTLNGNSVKLENRDDGDENDDNEDSELEGSISSQIANGTKVEVNGTRQTNDGGLAKKVEFD